MGRDVVIDGRLKTKDALAASELWAARVDGAAVLRDVPAPFGASAASGTIGALLEHVGGSLDGAAVVVRCVVPEGTFSDHAPSLARVWASAGARGARGALHVAGLDAAGPAFRLTAEPTGVKIATLAPAEQARIAKAPWVIDALATVAPAEAVFDEAVRLARALAPDELFRLAASLAPPLPSTVTVRLPKKPIDEAFVLPHVAFPTPERLAQALAGKPSDWHGPFALLVVAAHDPALAEPLALRALDQTSAPESHLAATLALASATTDTALARLLAELGRSRGAGIALARSRHPQLDAALLGALETSLPDVLAPGFDARSRVAEVLFAIGQRRMIAAEAMLCAAWAKRASTPGVYPLAATLAALDTKAAHAAVAEELGARDPALALLAARSFLRLDPRTAPERARPHLADARCARALFEALADAPAIDDAWRALAAGYDGDGFAKAAAVSVAARAR